MRKPVSEPANRTQLMKQMIIAKEQQRSAQLLKSVTSPSTALANTHNALEGMVLRLVETAQPLSRIAQPTVAEMATRISWAIRASSSRPMCRQIDDIRL